VSQAHTSVANRPHQNNSAARPGEDSAQRQQQGLAKRVQYQPLAPIGTGGGLKSLLESQRDSIAAALPKHVTPERIIKTMLVAANRNPALLECTQASILETINRAAELGLDLSGTLGEAYPVPFNNKIKVPNGNGGTTDKWVKQCQLIIGYRGLEKLAWQSGEVKMIDAEVVYENDHFIFKKGFDPVLEWEPCRGDRGKPVGAYACIITKNEGRMARFMTVADIEKIRAGAQSKDSPAWRNHWDEMARKTVLRRTMKDAPLSTEKLVAAMEQDDNDYNLTNVLEASTGLGALPEGRSSFREQAAPEVVDAPQDDETGEQVGGEQPTTQSAPADNAPRDRWPMNAKDGPAQPGYWRASLIAKAKKWCQEFEAEAHGNDPKDMVNRLEDGHADPIGRIPGPQDGASLNQLSKVVNLYKAAVAEVDASPDVWARYVVPV
jgi:recombination protein RecT